jgi:hypothetical protein
MARMASPGPPMSPHHDRVGRGAQSWRLSFLEFDIYGQCRTATFGGKSVISIALLAAPLALTSIEFCSAAPEPPATEPPESHWRMVDGKKCYFRADKLLPREDLVWSYDGPRATLAVLLNKGSDIRNRRFKPQRARRAGACFGSWPLPRHQRRTLSNTACPRMSAMHRDPA